MLLMLINNGLFMHLYFEYNNRKIPPHPRFVKSGVFENPQPNSLLKKHQNKGRPRLSSLFMKEGGQCDKLI